MTVSLVTVISEYIGLSSDTKPEDCPPGSRFTEVDTATLFVWDGADWQEQ